MVRTSLFQSFILNHSLDIGVNKIKKVLRKAHFFYFIHMSVIGGDSVSVVEVVILLNCDNIPYAPYGLFNQYFFC